MTDYLARYTLRINRFMLKKLAHISYFNGRSMNKEIEFIIKESIKDFENRDGKITFTDNEK